MAKEPSRTLGPTSDLVVLAAWKPGIIPADEAILPASRLARTFQTLYQIRKTAREAAEPSTFADPIERLEQIHSFRLKAVPQGMLLSVTYDFGWEPYMRALWRDARPFLDLLLCHCKDYGLARETDIDPWAAWIRKRELVSDLFYSATPLTVSDIMGLGQAERLQRDEADAALADRQLGGLTTRAPATIAAENRARAPATAMQQGLGILSAMHRLTRFYSPNVMPKGPNPTELEKDALTLLRAAKGLLEGWNPDDVVGIERQRFARELAWYCQPEPEPSFAMPQVRPLNRAAVQRGVLTPFDTREARIQHGAALYLMITCPHAARSSLAGLALASENAEQPEDGVFRNLAFSFEGMQRLQLPADVLAAMPAALREGAAARAGSVGDVRAFHPGRWRPLPRNWPKGSKGTADISIVDVVIQLRTARPGDSTDIYDRGHPLHAAIAAVADLKGLRLLSVDVLGNADPKNPDVDALGFVDGISQPTVDETRAQGWTDTVAAGELLLGYPNDAQDAVSEIPLLAGGSFLAIRRMPIRADRFSQMLEKAAAQTGLAPDLIAEKIVGRARNGKPLVAAQGSNDFLYSEDPDGAHCPRQSHVRRSNPRQGKRTPRIMRRGMAFLPIQPGAQSGSLFMAYCADLAEQYEVILRWINGGNSARIGSFNADPLCSVPELGKSRTFRFIHDDKAYRVALPASQDAPIGLSWSLYLFAPSLDLVKSLDDKAAQPAAGADPETLELLQEASDRIKDMLKRKAPEEEWRNCLDEPGAKARGLQRAMWAIIRTEHGGVLDTKDLVLVGSHAQIMEVMRDDGHIYSVKGAGDRIVHSIEKFHLGLDAYADDYKREGPACNDAIRRVTDAMGFDAARAATAAILASLLEGRAAPVRIDAMKDLLEPVMARIAPAWYDLPDGHFVRPGASDWRDLAQRNLVFPGDFWYSSRYAFNPFTSGETERLSSVHGKALLKAIDAFIRENGREVFKGTISAALAKDTTAFPDDHDLARALAGAMLGWIATTLGNAARLLDSWVSSGELHRRQAVWVDEAEKSFANASALFGRSMETTIGQSPVPECKWRVLQQDAALGGKAFRNVPKGRKVVLCLESAVADQAGKRIHDSWSPFGMAMPETPDTKHGCPGRDMALGVLLGVLVGMAETASVRSGGGRLMLDISPQA